MPTSYELYGLEFWFGLCEMLLLYKVGTHAGLRLCFNKTGVQPSAWLICDCSLAIRVTYKEHVLFLSLSLHGNAHYRCISVNSSWGKKPMETWFKCYSGDRLNNITTYTHTLCLNSDMPHVTASLLYISLTDTHTSVLFCWLLYANQLWRLRRTIEPVVGPPHCQNTVSERSYFTGIRFEGSRWPHIASSLSKWHISLGTLSEYPLLNLDAMYLNNAGLCNGTLFPHLSYGSN